MTVQAELELKDKIFLGARMVREFVLGKRIVPKQIPAATLEAWVHARQLQAATRYDLCRMRERKGDFEGRPDKLETVEQYQKQIDRASGLHTEATKELDARQTEFEVFERLLEKLLATI